MRFVRLTIIQLFVCCFYSTNLYLIFFLNLVSTTTLLKETVIITLEIIQEFNLLVDFILYHLKLFPHLKDQNKNFDVTSGNNFR